MQRLTALLGLSDGELRLARIKALPDDVLVRYCILLQDNRVVRNVPSLRDLLNEALARGLSIRDH